MNIVKGTKLYHKNSDSTIEVVKVVGNNITGKVINVTPKTPAYIKINSIQKTGVNNVKSGLYTIVESTKVKIEEDKPSDFSFNTYSIVEKESNAMEYVVAYPDKKGKETREGLEGWESHDKANRELYFADNEKEAKKMIKGMGIFENKSPLSLVSLLKESNIGKLKSNQKAWKAAEAIINGEDERRAQSGQDYLDTLSPEESKPYFDYIEQRLDGDDLHEDSSPQSTQTKSMTNVRVNVEKILRFLVAAAKRDKKNKELHTELTRFNSIQGLLDKSNLEAVVAGYTMESKNSSLIETKFKPKPGIHYNPDYSSKDAFIEIRSDLKNIERWCKSMSEKDSSIYLNRLVKIKDVLTSLSDNILYNYLK